MSVVVNIFGGMSPLERKAFSLAQTFPNNATQLSEKSITKEMWNKRVVSGMKENGFDRDLAVRNIINQDQNFASLRS